MSRFGERVFGWLLGLYPREFRQQYREDLAAFFRQERTHPKYGTGPFRGVRFWSATLTDLLRTAWSERAPGWSRAAADRPALVRHLPHAHYSPIARLRTDLRDGWRGLWSSAGVTIAALTVLMLGIGASTAIFSVVDAVALRGLPFDEGTRLVSVSETNLPSGSASPVAPQNYADWRARQDVFEHLAAASFGPTLVPQEPPRDSLRSYAVTASLFDVLRVAPAYGRRILERDERPDAPRVVVLSDRVWRSRFGSNPAVIGQVVAFESGAYEIVGIMPPGFTYPVSRTGVPSVDVWIPFVWTPSRAIRGNSRTYSLSVVGRLRPDVTLELANVRMTQIRDALAVEHPTWFNDHGVLVRRLQDVIVPGQIRSWMVLLLGAVMFVLLIACLNVANLLLARATARVRELAVRAALGATRWDLARALLFESLMLAVIGTVGGVLLALWGVEILRTNLPGNVPRLATASVDLRVLAMAAGAALASGIVFGTLPAVRLSRPDILGLLRQGGRSDGMGGASQPIRTAFVVVQIALSVVLLSGAGLFVTSFVRVATRDLGFDPTRVSSIWVGGALMSSDLFKPPTTPAAGAKLVAARAQLFTIVDRIRAIPGVTAVSPLIGGLPLSGNSVTLTVQHADRQSPAFTGDAEPFVHGVGPEYLDVMQGRLLRGRWIRPDDTDGAQPIVVLSDEAVRRYFGERDPIGARLLLDGVERTIVGVAQSMRLRGPELPPYAEAFVPYLQTTQENAEIVLRAAAGASVMLPAVQAAVREAAPQLTVDQPSSLERRLAELMAQRRFNMIVLAVFGALAVAIAAAAVYGLMAFLVTQRTREIGVRVALGAVPRGIVGLVLRRAAALIVAGLTIGLAGAAAIEPSIRSFLFDARPHDLALYAGVAAILLAVGLFAALGPARRAARVDPLVALRAD
jgi:putative ABC transport system permease protein